MSEIEILRCALAQRDAVLANITAQLECLLPQVQALRKRAEEKAPAPAALAASETAEAAEAHDLKREQRVAEAFANADRLAEAVDELKLTAALRGMKV